MEKLLITEYFADMKRAQNAGNSAPKAAASKPEIDAGERKASVQSAAAPWDLKLLRKLEPPIMTTEKPLENDRAVTDDSDDYLIDKLKLPALDIMAREYANGTRRGRVILENDRD